jgi:acetyl esterase/lipase
MTTTSGPGRGRVLLVGVLVGVLAVVVGHRILAGRWLPDDPDAGATGSPGPSPTPTPVGLTAGPQVIKDLAYAPVSPAQRLDLYLPARTGRAVPLVINIHGGAFAYGDKADEVVNVARLTREGYAVASLNYRLSGEARFPAGVQDVKAAVRWLRGNAARYGLDPGRFAAWGSSAGGHLASMLGVTGWQSTELDDPALGFADRSSAVQAVVAWYAPSDFLAMDRQNLDPGGCPGVPLVHALPGSPESRWLGGAIEEVADRARAASVVHRLRDVPDAADRIPPFYLVHGDADCSVPRGQSMELADELRRAGVPVDLHLVPGAMHADPKIVAAQADPSIDFVLRVLGRP